jgi:phthalate 4,5-dioxygenase reductase subunit
MLYLGASRSEAAYSAEFTGDPDVIFHMRDEHADRFDLWNVLRDPGEREVYCCGSPALMEQVRALTMHWRPSRVHFEDFSGVSPLDEFSSPFSASWEPTGDVFPVSAGVTLLEAMRSAGIVWPSSCNTGTCGACKVSLLWGEADHRDVVLTEEERKNFLTPCVSRGDNVIRIGPA